LTVDCQVFGARLTAYVANRLTAGERLAADEHLRACAACRALVALARLEPRDCAVEPPGDLLESVLGRTSGSACAAARDRLAERVAEPLEAGDERLVLGHVERCADCAALARILACLARDLPRLAEVEPDARLLAEVLARTSRRPTWTARALDAWQRLAQRPRLALEGAYVGTVVFLLIFGLSNEPAAATRRALDSLRQPPAAATTTWRHAQSLASAVARTSASTLSSLRAQLGTLWLGAASQPEEPATSPRRADGDHEGDER
jgi:predicted anti-sigma-YlaC factor YlaD